MLTDQATGASSIPNRGTQRPPEAIRAEIGLILLVGLEIETAILQPIAAFARPDFFSPLVSYDIDRAIAIIATLLFGVAAALVVTGRRPLDLHLSNRTLSGFVLWIAVTLYGNFAIPYLLPLLVGSAHWYVVFAVDEMVESVIAATGVALLTYNLQSRNGKLLLWLASLAGIVVAVSL